jgi:hypothetical protein
MSIEYLYLAKAAIEPENLGSPVGEVPLRVRLRDFSAK